MPSAEFHSAVQRARAEKRWRHTPPGNPQPRNSKRVAKAAKVSAAPQAAFLEQARQIYKLIEALAASAGITPTRLPDINRVTRGRGPASQLPMVVPEVNTPLFIRAKARMSQERGKDLPVGYWGRK